MFYVKVCNFSHIFLSLFTAVTNFSKWPDYSEYLSFSLKLIEIFAFHDEGRQIVIGFVCSSSLLFKSHSHVTPSSQTSPIKMKWPRPWPVSSPLSPFTHCDAQRVGMPSSALSACDICACCLIARCVFVCCSSFALMSCDSNAAVSLY